MSCDTHGGVCVCVCRVVCCAAFETRFRMTLATLEALGLSPGHDTLDASPSDCRVEHREECHSGEAHARCGHEQ